MRHNIVLSIQTLFLLMAFFLYIPQAVSKTALDWSVKPLEITALRGTSQSVAVELYANKDLADISLAVVPELSDHVYISPNNIPILAAGEQQTIVVSTNISTDAPLGTFSGTIHVNSGARTLSLPLEIVLNIKDPDLSVIPDVINAPSADRIYVETDTTEIYVKDELLILLNELTAIETFLPVITDLGGQIIGSIPGVNQYQVRFPGQEAHNLPLLIDQLKEYNFIRWAGKHSFLRNFSEFYPLPDDPLFIPWDENENNPNNWGQRFIKLPEAWEILNKTPSTPIAVLDSYFDCKHEDILTNVSLCSGTPRDFGDDKYLPTTNHGTVVAGIVGAQGNNNVGIAGVTWDTNLHLYADGPVDQWIEFCTEDYCPLNTGSWALAQGHLIAAAQSGIRVVNWSREMIDCDWWEWYLGRYPDVLVVSAAGNDYSNVTGQCVERLSGNEQTNVIAVAASTINIDPDTGDTWLWYENGKGSNYGEGIHIAAPGYRILSTTPSNIYSPSLWGGYVERSGTSFAGPFVSGLAGLLLSHDETLDTGDIKQLIEDGAKCGIHKHKVSGHNMYVIDAYQSLVLADTRFTSEPITVVDQGDTYEYCITVSNPEPNNTYDILFSETLPDWLNDVPTDTGTCLQGTPGNDDVGGPDSIKLALYVNGCTTTDKQQYEITVNNINEPPYFSENIQDLMIQQDQYFEYTVTATDPDIQHGDSISITPTVLPSWLTFTNTSDNSAIFSGTPTYADVGEHSVILNVSDGVLSNSLSFTITVTVSGGSEPTTFSIGDSIEVAADAIPYVNVRDTPDGTIISTELPGTIGVIIDGPVWADQLWWWQIEFEDGTIGWVVSDYLLVQPFIMPDINNKTISGGWRHTAALTIDGQVWSWGGNWYGQLGDGTTTTRLNPVQVVDNLGVPLTDIETLAAGYAHTLALTNDGRVMSWGDNQYGQLGDGTTTNRINPVFVVDEQGNPILNVVAIATSSFHSVAVTKDGRVWTWGFNYFYGQLGDGTTTNRPNPVLVVDEQGSPLTNIIAITAGRYHTAAVTSAGNVWTWGDNSFGQLGDGTTTKRYNPVLVLDMDGIPLTGVDTVAAGAAHTVALSNEGNVWAWGYNHYGILGDGTNTDKLNPVLVVDTSGNTLTDVIDIASGYIHNAALTIDGRLWTWGSNQYGELCNGTFGLYYPEAVPVTPSTPLDNVVSTTTGSYHTIALTRDGLLLTCGNNQYGQLGDSTYYDHPYPMPVVDEQGNSLTNFFVEYTEPTLDPSLLEFVNGHPGDVNDGITVIHDYEETLLAVHQGFTLMTDVSVSDYPEGFTLEFYPDNLLEFSPIIEMDFGNGTIPGYVLSPTYSVVRNSAIGYGFDVTPQVITDWNLSGSQLTSILNRTIPPARIDAAVIRPKTTDPVIRLGLEFVNGYAGDVGDGNVVNPDSVSITMDGKGFYTFTLSPLLPIYHDGFTIQVFPEDINLIDPNLQLSFNYIDISVSGEYFIERNGVPGIALDFPPWLINSIPLLSDIDTVWTQIKLTSPTLNDVRIDAVGISPLN